MNKEVQEIFSIRDSENIRERMPGPLGKAVYNAVKLAQRWDKELDILHSLITELYNNESNVPAIKTALDKISKLKP